MKNGLYENLNNKDYHNIDGVSSTQFAMMELSQRVYELRHLFKYDNSNFDIGNLLHTAILEPHLLDKEFLEGKTLGIDTESNKALKFLHSDKIIVGKGMISEAKEIANRVHQVFPEIFANSDTKYEISAFYSNTDIGLLFKARPDILFKKPNKNEYIIFDIKSSKEVTKKGFESTIEKYNYPLSASWYLDTLRLLGINVVAFGWIVIPKTVPNKPFAMMCSDELLEKGRDKYNTLLNEYMEYKNNGYDERKYTVAHSYEYRRNNYTN